MLDLLEFLYHNYFIIYRKFYTLTISLFGHRNIPNKEEVRQILYNYLQPKLKHNVVKVLIGTHGDFDRIALGVCKQLKREGYDIDIILVFTSYRQIKKEFDYIGAENDYEDIETMIYEIEDIYYKRQIIESNQKMVDESDEIIVYYTGKPQLSNNKGTYFTMQYAKKKNKALINLFQ